ncbi:MATE family efflux transporter [Raoultibacter phocaeensis]|uniref:MATE family efflux transporter n=1 Tax=Raoultibacter phocaeensis TaxID=2479841 RepID=UPI002107B9CE|nr:MATE family efflux transporter [Raoultibacter phocaeensis]
MDETLDGPIGKQFARYVSLNVFGMIAMSVYILADTFFIANGVGADGLAALNFAIVIWTIMQATGLMLGIGGATKFQVFKSQGNTGAASRTFSNAVMLALVAAAVYLVAVNVFATPISHGLGADADTLELTSTYLRVIFCFAPFFLMNNVLLPFVRNDGSPQLAMAGMILGSMANILLDYLFIMVFEWGMFGAAFATGIAPILSMAVLSIHFIKRKNTFTFVKTRPDFSLMRSIAALGISSFIVEITGGVVLFIFNLIILSFEGNTGVAAYGIVANLAFVATALFVGTAQGIQPLASHNYAQGHTGNLNKVLRYTLLTALVISVLVIAVVWLFADPLAAAFNRDNDPRLTALAADGMRIYFVGYLFAGANIVAAAFFSAVEEPARGLAISIVRGFVAIVAFVFVLAALFGMTGVWATFPAAEAATACLTAFFLVRFVRKRGVRRAG